MAFAAEKTDGVASQAYDVASQTDAEESFAATYVQPYKHNLLTLPLTIQAGLLTLPFKAC